MSERRQSAEPPPAVQRRLRVLIILQVFDRSAILILVKPLLVMHRKKWIWLKVTLETSVQERDVRHADVVVFCRNTTPGLAFLQWLVDHKKPYIYDLDDNFFEIPSDLTQGWFNWGAAQLDQLERYLANAALVRVYSQRLLERASKFNQNVQHVVGPVDFSLVAERRPANDTKKVKIVYATSRIDDRLYRLFLPDLRRILEEFSDRIEVWFLGFCPSELVRHPVVHAKEFRLDYDRYLRTFSQAGYDIGLAPMPGGPFYLSKTNNKYREYGACRIAGVYSDVVVYNSCVVDGETGLLVSQSPGAWYEAMARLIRDRELRESIQARAYENVQQHYAQTIFEEVWYAQMQSVLAQSRCRRYGKRTGSPERGPQLAAVAETDPVVGAQALIDKRLGRRLQALLGRLRGQSLRAHLFFVRCRWNNHWMVWKLSVLTSPLVDYVSARCRARKEGL